MIRFLFAAALLVGATTFADAEAVLRVGDQKGNTQAVTEAAGVLKDVPYKIEWKEFAAAAPLLEALGAGAIDTGLVGDAPFTFAAAANVRAKAIAAIRQSGEGLAILVPENSAIKSFEELRGRRSQRGAARSAISSFWLRWKRRGGRLTTCRSFSSRRRMPRLLTARARSTPGRPGSPMSARRKCFSDPGG
jgi:ABC-type nitrate/sulfonate/bicarbonate transport system substrate-binding protein